MKQEANEQRVETGKLYDTAGVIQTRLNTDYVLERIRIFLTGKVQSVVYDEDGNRFVKEEVKTTPKANDEGIHSILNFVENIVNPVVVQGNFTEDYIYENYIDFVLDSLITNIMNNLHKWQVKEEDFEPIIDNIRAIVEPFMTRLLENKERESYAQSVRVVESSNVQTSKGKIFNN